MTLLILSASYSFLHFAVLQVLSPPPHSINKCLGSRQIAVVCVDCQRIRGPRQKCSLPSSSACEGISFRLGVHKGVPKSSPPFKIRCKTRLLLHPQSPPGGHRHPHFSPCYQCCHLPLPLLLPAGASRPRKGRGVTKDIFGAQQDNPVSVPPPELSPSPRPMLGQSLVIRFHLQSLYISSAALPPGMVGQVLSLRAKCVTESIRL